MNRMSLCYRLSIVFITSWQTAHSKYNSNKVQHLVICKNNFICNTLPATYIRQIMSPAVKARMPSVTGGPETPGSTRQLTAARNTGRQQWQLSTLSQLLTPWLQRKKFQNDYFLLQTGDIGHTVQVKQYLSVFKRSTIWGEKPQRLPFLPPTVAFKYAWARWGEKYLLILCLPSAHTNLFAEPLRSVG